MQIRKRRRVRKTSILRKDKEKRHFVISQKWVENKEKKWETLNS